MLTDIEVGSKEIFALAGSLDAFVDLIAWLLRRGSLERLVEAGDG